MDHQGFHCYQFYIQLMEQDYIVVADAVFNQELTMAIYELFLMGVMDEMLPIRN